MSTTHTILQGRDGLRKFLRYYQHKLYPKAAPHFREVTELQEQGHLILGAHDCRTAQLHGAGIVIFPRLGASKNTRLQHHFARAHCAHFVYTSGFFYPLIAMACEEAKARNYQALHVPYESSDGFAVFWNTGKKEKVLQRKTYMEPKSTLCVGRVHTSKIG